MYIKLLVALVVVINVNGLKNLPIQTTDSFTKYFGELEYIRILDDEIFYLLRDHSKFGYINKSDGKIKMAVKIQKEQKEQKVLGINEYYISLLQSNKIKNFNIKQKNLWFQKPFKNQKNSQISKISSVIAYPPFQYLLTASSIRRVPYMMEKQKQQDIIPQFFFNKTSNDLSRVQEFKNLLLMTQRLTKNLSTRKQNEKQAQILALISQITSKSPSKQNQDNQICIRFILDTKQKLRKCFSVGKDQNYVRAQFRAGLLYLVTELNTYVIDQSLKLKIKIDKMPVSFSQSVVIFEGGSSFTSSDNTIKQQLVFQSQKNKLYKLSAKQNKLTLALNQKNIAEILSQTNSKPTNFWITQNEPQIQDKNIELIVQWSDFSISFYKINEESKNTQQVWKLSKE